METNTNQPSPSASTKLLNDKESPLVDSFFDKKGDSLNIQKETLTSEQKAVKSDSPTTENTKDFQEAKEKSRLGQLNFYFFMFYKAMMVICILTSIGTILLLPTRIELTSSIKFDFLIGFWALKQYWSAYLGVMNKDLKRKEEAWKMMKTYLFLVTILLLNKLFEVISQDYDGEYRRPDYGFFKEGMAIIGLYVLLVLLPTRKVRNLLRLIPQKEEKSGDRMEEFNSFAFIAYKAWLVLVFCYEVQLLISWLFEGLTNLQGVLVLMISLPRYLVKEIYRYFFIKVSLIIYFFIFEGLRRKDLKKIEVSIKLMKIFLVGEFVLSGLLNIILWLNPDPYSMTHRCKSVPEFLNERLNYVLGGFFLIGYGALKARDILKTEEKPRYKL